MREALEQKVKAHEERIKGLEKRIQDFEQSAVTMSSDQTRPERSESRSLRRKPKVSSKQKGDKPVQKKLSTSVEPKGEPKGNIDEYSRLSKESKAWHKSLIRDTPHAVGRWKVELESKLLQRRIEDLVSG